MARISGINLPKEKRVAIALTYIQGIGHATSAKILEESGTNPDTRVKDLTSAEEGKIREIIEKGYSVEGNLKREVLGNIKRLKEIKSYRGSRHEKKLPSRGQRTKTNARAKRGKKMTIGSGRKKSAAKT